MVIKGPGFANGIIILEEPEAVYYSGQLLSGNVHFELNENLNYSAINLMCVGEARVLRTEMQYEMTGGNDRSRKLEYESKEQYFNFLQCICGGIGMSSLPPGVHSIPFQFQVPFNVPSSFKGQHGVVLYTISAYLEYPEPGRREELMIEFYVVAPISPNALAPMRQPLELDFEDIEMCYCFCDTRHVDLKITLPSQAFHMGSSIPITMKAQNSSSLDVYEICFKITKRHTYRTLQPRSEYTTPEETLVESKQGPISDMGLEFTCHLPLPAVALPNLESCSIIDVAYFLKVQIQVTGCNEPIEDESEIFIGILPEFDTFSVMSPDLVPHLPKAPVPNPNNQSIGIIPAQNYPANDQTPQRYGSQIAVPPEMTSNSPYEIGFRSATVSSLPYPVNNINSGAPYPVVPPMDAANSPYRTAPYSLHSPQTNISPSAPPL